MITRTEAMNIVNATIEAKREELHKAVVKWVEETVDAEIRKTAEMANRGVSVDFPEEFTTSQKVDVVNYLRTNGFTAEKIDNDTLGIKW